MYKLLCIVLGYIYNSGYLYYDPSNPLVCDNIDIHNELNIL